MAEKVVRGRPLKMRDWIVNALCIAIGALTRIYGVGFGPYMISANVGAVLAGLFLTQPRFKETCGVAVITGIVATITSKAVFPANWVSDVVAIIAFWPLITSTRFVNMRRTFKAPYMYIITNVVLYIDWIIFFVVVALALGLPWATFIAWLPGMIVSSSIMQPLACEVLYFAAERVYRPA